MYHAAIVILYIDPEHALQKNAESQMKPPLSYSTIIQKPAAVSVTNAGNLYTL